MVRLLLEHRGSSCLPRTRAIDTDCDGSVGIVAVLAEIDQRLPRVQLEISLLVAAPVASVAVRIGALVATSRRSLVLALDTDVERKSLVNRLLPCVMNLVRTLLAKHLVALVAPLRQDSIAAVRADVGELDVRERKLDSPTYLALPFDENARLRPNRDVAQWIVPVRTLGYGIYVLDDDSPISLHHLTVPHSLSPSALENRCQHTALTITNCLGAETPG